MKDLLYVGIGFSVFSLVVLLSFIGNAFPAFYEGVHVVFAAMALLVVVFGLIVFLGIVSKRQGSLRRADIGIAMIPSIIGLVLLGIGYGLGLWSAIGGGR